MQLRKCLCLLMAILCVTTLLPVSLADDLQPAPQSYRTCCTPNKGERNVAVYASPSASAEKIAAFPQGSELLVTGASGSFYRVTAEEKQTGYVQKEQVRLAARASSQALPEQGTGSLTLETPIPKMYSIYLELIGNMKLDQPIDTVFAYLWDEKQFKVEASYIRALIGPTAKLDASFLQYFLPLGAVKGGRKTLVLQGGSNGELSVIFRSPVYIRGAQDDPASISRRCEGLVDNVLDTEVYTAWTPTFRQPSLTAAIPEGEKAALLTVEWRVIPDSFQVTVYGKHDKLLSETTFATGRYADWMVLPEGTRSVSVTPHGSAEAAISSMRIYNDTYSRHAVQQWEALPEKLDMLVVSTHQDDEFLFLGGTIPYYAWREDVTLGVMYMTEGKRQRMKEALDGLWTAGVKYYPIILGLEDKYTMSPQQAASRWKRYAPDVRVVRALRHYKPEVIVCQDFNGEYGHGQHRYTVELLAECLKLAADPTFDPQSAKQWGVWQVKKLYSHLYDQNIITMDWDSISLDSSGVVTAMFLAKEAYDKHQSQQSAFSMEKHGTLYDNTQFGLYYSAVGPDVEKNDFMENIH